jgi:hypothetical protein
MDRFRRSPVSPRKLALLCAVILLTAGLAHLSQPASHAVGVVEVLTFYSDATLTHQVGYCVTDSCDTTHFCSGQMTSFTKVSAHAC